MIVHVVMRNDGNVCCPGAELDSIWSTAKLAAARVSILKSADTRAHVDELQVDGDIVGQ